MLDKTFILLEYTIVHQCKEYYNTTVYSSKSTITY